MEEEIENIQAEDLFNDPIEGTVDIPEPTPVDDEQIVKEIEDYHRQKGHLDPGIVVVDLTRMMNVVPPTAEFPDYGIHIDEEKLKEKPKNVFIRRVTDTLLGYIHKNNRHNERTPRDSYER